MIRIHTDVYSSSQLLLIRGLPTLRTAFKFLAMFRGMFRIAEGASLCQQNMAEFGSSRVLRTAIPPGLAPAQ